MGYQTSGQQDLLPGRLQLGSMHTVEKVAGIMIMLFALASAVVCVVEGLTSHGEHVIFGIVILANTGLFFLIARLYRLDVLQDRKVVYFSAFMMVALCSTGLIFATHWKNPPKVDPYYGCTGPNDYFHVTNASNPDQTPHGECLKFNVPVNKTHLCYSLAKGAASSTTPVTGALLSGLQNLTTARKNCAVANAWVQACTGAKAEWVCPKGD